MKNKYILIAIISIVILLTTIGVYLIKRDNNNINNKPNNTNVPDDLVISDTPPNLNDEFEYNMIHLVNNYNDNYLISPFSIAYALSILRDGASGDTKTQIENALGNYKLDKITNIENRISTANALFIKNEHKNDIRTEYTDNIKNNYDAEIIYDEFKTPDVINNWASNKTYGMINNVVDQIDKDFVLGIINSLAIDVEWKNQFNEKSTSKELFTKLDNTQVEVDMMHTSEDVIYIENENAKGIIKDYKKYNDIELQFIAILPNNNIKDYINNFNKNELSSLLNNQKGISDNYEIQLSIPKFTLDFDYKDFKKDLITLGIQDAFNPSKAKFEAIETSDSNLNLYVNQAVHKSHIELTEAGTKAAAVTYFGLFKNTAVRDNTVIRIEFNRPFLYLIKDKNSDNIWFFGTIYNLN